MAAFRAAAEQGYDLIELDPAFTRDGVCVVLHDRTVNRTGRDAAGHPLPEPTPIGSLTWQEASRLDFGLWKSPSFAGEGLPLLSQALSFAREARVPLKLDNKAESFTPAQLEILFDVVGSSGIGPMMGFTCTREDYLTAVMGRFPEATIHYDGPVDEASLARISFLSAGHPLVVWLHCPTPSTSWCKTPPVSPERCALVRRFGAGLGLWILDSKEEMAEACALYAPDIIETPGLPC